jgi:hypothetical protein
MAAQVFLFLDGRWGSCVSFDIGTAIDLLHPIRGVAQGLRHTFAERRIEENRHASHD